MRNDQTFAADRLLASNPGEAAKQGVAPKGHCNVGDIFDKIKLNSTKKLEKTKNKTAETNWCRRATRRKATQKKQAGGIPSTTTVPN